MSDGIVTLAEVLAWLPDGIRRDLEMAMPPEQRGWFTEEETGRYYGEFVETRRMDEAEPRYLAVGIIFPILPTIANIAALTRAEISAGVKPDA